MTNQTETEKLFTYRDQFCSIKLVVAMVIDNQLQAATSSIYPSISGTGDIAEKQRDKLKNLYYIPRSSIQLSESTVLCSLIQDNFGELDKLSCVVLSDHFASNLVAQTASEAAEDELALTLGNASYRCAFSTKNGINFIEQSELFNFYGDKGFILSSNEQKNLALLVYAISSDKVTRDEIQALLISENMNGVENKLSSIDLIGDKKINTTTANKLAKLLVDNSVNELTTFLGINIYKPSW